MGFLVSALTCGVCVQVIAPEEIIDPSVDEQSVMTYLSQFPKAKLKPGAPLKPKLNPKKARAYGPGNRTRSRVTRGGGWGGGGQAAGCGREGHACLEEHADNTMGGSR